MIKTYRDSRGLLANVKPKCDEILNQFQDIPHVWTAGSTPNHNNLRCVDYMVFNDKELGNAIAQYHIDNANRLGVQGIIWARQVWRNKAKGGQYTSNPQRKWSKYTGPNPHVDHVHVQYDNLPIAGSKPAPAPKPKPKPKSYPKPSATCAVYLDKLRPGATNSDSVYRWQQAMNALSFVGGRELALTGNYDSLLVHETKLFQKQRCKDPQDGWPGPKQAQYGFQLAKSEMIRNGVKSLVIYRDSKIGITANNRVVKVW